MKRIPSYKELKRRFHEFYVREVRTFNKMLGIK